MPWNMPYQLDDLAVKLACQEAGARRRKRLRAVATISTFVALAVLIYG